MFSVEYYNDAIRSLNAICEQEDLDPDDRDRIQRIVSLLMVLKRSRETYNMRVANSSRSSK